MKVRVLLVLCGLSIAGGCGGGDGPASPISTATVSGIVREQESSRPIAGASVSLGGISTNSDQNGQFELRDVPLGSSFNISVSAPGYNPLSQAATVQAGANVVSLALVWNGLFDSGSFTMYLPPGVQTYRGVLVVMFGGSVNTRQLLRGELSYYQQFPLSGDVTSYRQVMIEFAQANNFAVMGGMFETSETSYSSMLGTLDVVATQSAHPELRNAGMLLHGHSARASAVFGFAQTHPDRTIGFVFAKGVLPTGDAARAAGVPGYFLFGQNDQTISADVANSIRIVVEQNRARGAPWAFAIEPGAGHAQVEDQELIFSWMTAVITARLTPGTGTIRPAAESSGWLGGGTSFVIAPYACFSGDKTAASWLPTEQTARRWQAHVSSGTSQAVIACGG
jgi:pimeloyl-ACP methyl ester carboxylesterase